MKNNFIYVALLIGLPILIYAQKIFPSLNSNNSMKWIVGGVLILYLLARWITNKK